MTNTKETPCIPADLLRWLNSRYPEQSPSRSWQEKDIWWHGGERSVIQFLNNEFRKQQEKSDLASAIKGV